MKVEEIIIGMTIQDTEEDLYEVLEILGSRVRARKLNPREDEDDIYMIHVSNISIGNP